ncbi:protein LURP-one-related 7 isoform X2 [Cucurbita pepo subsp. pepo]|uniref:protein LURP-one-related 7 isoform X2 n=1 Tax=Cucurbita pepo subsp. pepo TaxID=3664 RepID=UPI000C9D6124|nr:protein LURP-one-related 7 isoform X2 [Cucurbita pepo subsp. pepo]
MANSSDPAICAAPLPIPVDLFLSKKHPDHVTTSSGNIIFRLSRQSLKSSSIDKIVLHDAAAAAAAGPLISIHRVNKESWQGFKGDIGEQDLLFKVERTLNKLRRTEFKVFLVGENSDDSNASLEMKGFPFQRSCTIYKGNTIVAQTSLMHKLHQICVRRGRFRLTIFPGTVDPSLIVALIVIFFDGRI